MLHSSVPAALWICPCAATAATHARAVLGVLPFTNKASREPCALHHLPPSLPGCCSHLAHPDSPGWITAESTPHAVSSVLHTHPNTGVKATATPQQSSCGAAPGFILLCQDQAIQQHSRFLAAARLPCWHLELPLGPTTDPSEQTGAARQTRSLPFKFSCALGNGSRLDLVCSRRSHPKMEKCSQQMGRAMKGKDSSS